MTITVVTTSNRMTLEEAIERQDEDMEDDAGQTMDMLNEDFWGNDGDDPDGEKAMEKYYDAQACWRDMNTPPQYR